MDNLSNKIILYLGRTPNFETEVILQDDGSGPYIKEWNITSEKAKPTDSQLNALASDAVKLNNNEIVGINSPNVNIFKFDYEMHFIQEKLQLITFQNGNLIIDKITVYLIIFILLVLTSFILHLGILIILIKYLNKNSVA